jgi:hypothetical protein
LSPRCQISVTCGWAAEAVRGWHAELLHNFDKQATISRFAADNFLFFNSYLLILLLFDWAKTA